MNSKNLLSENLLSVVTYKWTEWVIFLFVSFVFNRFDDGSVPSRAFTMDTMNT